MWHKVVWQPRRKSSMRHAWELSNQFQMLKKVHIMSRVLRMEPVHKTTLLTRRCTLQVHPMVLRQKSNQGSRVPRLQQQLRSTLPPDPFVLNLKKTKQVMKPFCMLIPMLNKSSNLLLQSIKQILPLRKSFSQELESAPSCLRPHLLICSC